MSDDEDYMSDKFLQNTEKHVSLSLMYKRIAEIKSNQSKACNKPIKVIEQEKREEGLSSAISNSNKGFQMLTKMGYKPGQGIGKTQSGMVEPIPVEVKADRQGLGKKKRKELYGKNMNAKMDNTHIKDFRSRMAQKKTEQLEKCDLYKSQKVCQELDTKENVEKPDESWFWPLNKEEKPDDEDGSSEEDDEDDESLDDSEKLEILTKHLRKKYFYCIWCGTKFNNEDDLRDNCPGSTRNDH
ncbi:hypothetical protein DMN91_009031 [Ooceraea biroi]|uniref:G patch domain-containing protein 11 n=1 Tax=Ooceraea biroi TaxID=2015173 RepID=A0A026WSL5_OOCBI|nr:G patch domain-containing protein 11 [Ooceraea biroi]XP_011331710.1 G patch domain-containing protein 11 [Ooceraea biroi]XP_011331712.1 G patch domain-containing protein 11 [Ooceraea biroi]XP_019886189.1 G patch domain-containing protein 11 [Ooceraea biroi]EZA58631.1 Coiled-coil domain-containing protein [Ooceraea biroi]RLU18674.1 hypothetical protein DMN91_009031 [Ooceraea biroi]